MAERHLRMTINDLWLDGWVTWPAKPNLTLSIGFAGESERFSLNGSNAIEEIRNLHYAIGRLLEQANDISSDPA